MDDLHVIRLKNAVFYAYHGTGEDEQNLGGKFECDVEMYTDLMPAAEADSLKKTVDYEKAYSCIQNIVLQKKFNLIEALANTIAKGLLREFYNLERVNVRVRKPHPPVRGVVDYVEVEVSRER
ncbi:MAG: dihydroneopterin aldolase [Bacteroidetes bacterium]|nr:dihydroneopterin aldolase [Bacteroidota bacterium]